MMTAAQTESLRTQGVRSLEVRWIFSGELAGVVDGWFARFPAETERREDTYRAERRFDVGGRFGPGADGGRALGGPGRVFEG